ncbi:hypothetical protein A2662_02685 [Candidatus Giovannonibacteria bacterium RIFCSPHIGHO2_01_FULL_45_33]|nr:MAG: hypothetical protein A2662_02685 [Candidatus Giovannonibacteria bacterium RIFCSPHIGHO2_01_FULL_45_33]
MKSGRLLFIVLLLSAAFPVFAKVVINEVAWMGTQTSAADEWIELYSDHEWNLAGWTLITADGGTKINLKSSSSTANYYLIERTDDSAVPDVKADLVLPFGKGLSNDGEILILKDAGGNIVDQVDGSNGWPIGGEVANKNTLQRAKNDPLRWITAVATPKAENAVWVARPIEPKPSPSAAGSPEKKSYTRAVNTVTDENVQGEQNNSEYLWLLGGILGGAVLGLVFIMAKRLSG